MLDLGALRLSIVTDTDKAKQDISSFKDTINKTGESMTKMGSTLTKAVTLPIIGIATACVKTASDVNEGMNKMNAVFGKSSDEVSKWADSSAKDFGMSKNSFMDYVSTFGGLSQDMLKMNEQQSAEFSKQILQRSADISSYYNMTIDESNSLMQQLYSGETDGWKRLGITINDTTMQEYAHSKGIQQNVSDMSLQEKTMLRVQMAMEKTNRAEGDFQKTKNGLANSSRILQAQLSDLATVIGTALLPTVTSIVSNINDVISSFISWGQENPAILDVIIKIAGALALLGPTLLAVGTAMQLSTTIGTTLLSAFNPITGVILAIVAAVALLAYAWTNNIGGLKDKTTEAFSVVKATFEEVAPQLQAIFTTLFDILKSVWETVGVPLFSAFGDLVKILGNLFAEVFPVIVNIVSAAFTVISNIWNNVLKPVFTVFIAIVGTLYNIIKTNFQLIQAIFTVVFAAIEALWNITLKPVFDDLVDIVKAIYSKIKQPLEDVKEAFTACFDWICEKIQGALDLVEKLIKKAKEVAEFFKGGSSSGSSSSSNGKTKYFADGGILTKATTFGFMGNTRLVGGEAGAEAIIPLDRLPQILKDAGLGGGSNTFNYYSPENISASEAARLFKQTQKELALGLL